MDNGGSTTLMEENVTNTGMPSEDPDETEDPEARAPTELRRGGRLRKANTRVHGPEWL